MPDTKDKTEKATPRRRKEALKEGRSPRSPELGAWIALLVIATLLPRTVRSATELFRTTMVESTAGFADPTADTARRVLHDGLMGLAGVLAPLGLAAVVTAIAVASAQGGLRVTPKRLKPDWKHLNPLQGIKKLFGPQTLWEAAKSLMKTGVIALTLWLVIRRMMPRLAESGSLPVNSVLSATTGSILSMMRLAAVAGVAIAMGDYLVQRRRFEKSIRMSKHDIKQEHKQTDGDPLLRSAMRSRAIRMSRNRMMSDLVQADVVVVNPTHVAVALKYDPARGAPRVIAKGAGAIAAKIRERATEYRVPMVEDVPLARALHRSCEIGQEVPPELFTAVARVLALVMSLKRRGVAAGVHRPRFAPPAA